MENSVEKWHLFAERSISAKYMLLWIIDWKCTQLDKREGFASSSSCHQSTARTHARSAKMQPAAAGIKNKCRISGHVVSRGARCGRTKIKRQGSDNFLPHFSARRAPFCRNWNVKIDLTRKRTMLMTRTHSWLFFYSTDWWCNFFCSLMTNFQLLMGLIQIKLCSIKFSAG